MVSLGYDLAQHLPGLRREAESRFTETVVFFTASEETDPETLDVVAVESPIGETAARVKVNATQRRDVESGGQHPVLSRLEVHVAVGSVDAPTGSFVRVVASTADSSLVGNVYRVSEPHAAGNVTAWRYPVEEVS